MHRHEWCKRFVQLVLHGAWVDELSVRPVSTVTYSYCTGCRKVLL